ncbi:3-deoxy-7-phosphoheptulonate synthase [Clostridium sp. 19966]|uniref:3-deoxy-7-phosphoheptulonate synthase n=1 Tax=Clostridium sp. 19966 TaxID=2768166 RepID=UPI0028DE6AE3|nr:3-deoxy-7-phosphoheptulonate synthase [Clostridium sp. 19966]MDT8716292.1 3-deoxy-7-phosphoheptulonate synthase [Clostridium sp. 19966]
MNIEFKKKLPSSSQIINEIPLPTELKSTKKIKDKELADIIKGESSKFLLIIGPCSADNEDSVCEYTNRLAYLQEKFKDKIMIVPRVYTNKPRSTGEGYMGMVHQPDPTKSPDLEEGIKAIRKLHIRVLKESNLVTADEMLYPENYTYLSDVLSYVAIGARSVEDQQHRLTVSGMSIPAGMKNPTSGDISVMLNSITAAQIEHTFVYNGYEVDTKGNYLAHAVLRGAVDFNGKSIPNYHYENLLDVYDNYIKRGLKYPTVIVDTNHSNSNKKYFEQPRIAKEILFNRKYNPNLKKLIKGLMIESYLVEGRQEIEENIYGKSITDPCLGWEDTEDLIKYIYENL